MSIRCARSRALFLAVVTLVLLVPILWTLLAVECGFAQGCHFARRRPAAGVARLMERDSLGELVAQPSSSRAAAAISSRSPGPGVHGSRSGSPW